MRLRPSTRTLALSASAAALLGCAVAASPAAAAGTGPGTFAGTLGITVPKGANVDVRAIDRASGVVAGTARGSKTGAFSLSLPAGSYQVVGTVVKAAKGKSKGSVQTVSAGVTLAAGQRRKKVDVKTAKTAKAKKKTKKKAAKKAQREYAQELGQVTPGSVAVAIPDFSGGGSDPSVKGWNELMMIDAMHASEACPDSATGSDVVYVETDRRADIEQELAFQQSQYVDPSTRITRNFIVPDVTVVGTVTELPGGDRSLTVDIRDQNGQSLGSSTSTVHESSAFDDLESAATKLGQDLCTLGTTYEVDLDATGSGNLSTHTGTGTLHAQLIARRTGQGTWAGSGQLQWSVTGYGSLLPNAVALNPVAAVSPWHAALALQPDGQLLVSWGLDGSDLATLSLDVIPDPGDTYDPPPIPGLAFLSLIGAGPPQSTVPAGGGGFPISGGVLTNGKGFSSNGTVTVKRLGTAKGA
ncbi:MAG: hypothetical protein AAGC46_17505 [Solirubrobacteraceae bacterium]|nr:hypothetical protein [Patulibacter sp.]